MAFCPTSSATSPIIPWGRGGWPSGSTSGHLVTARRHPLRAVEHLSDAVAEGEVLKSPAHALARFQEVFTDLVEQRLSVLGVELGRLEDEVLADRDHIGREALGPLRRELSRYAREFAALRSAIHRATTARGASLAEPAGGISARPAAAGRGFRARCRHPLGTRPAAL